jgi:histone deacetylase complex regulatory component SIN3
MHIKALAFLKIIQVIWVLLSDSGFLLSGTWVLYSRAQQSTPEHARARQSTPEHARERQSTTEHDRARQSTTEHDRARQSTPVHARAHQSTPEQARAHQSTQEQARAHQSTQEHSSTLEVAIIFISLVKTIFFITGCVNQCPIHHFKSIESIKL